MKMKHKKKGGSGNYSFPSALSEPMTELSDYSLWIYGAPGIGKTSLVQQFEGVRYIMGERGAKALRVRAVYPRNVKEFEGFVTTAEAEDFPNICVDGVHAIYQLYWRAAMKKLNIEHPSDEGYGKGWDAVQSPFSAGMLRVLRMDKGSILISHAASGERRTRDGDTIDDVHPNLSGKALDWLVGETDIVGYYHSRRNRATLQIRQTDDVLAKCRLEENFRYTDGSAIKFIDMGDNKEEAFQNLMAAFNNELDPPVIEKKGGARLKKKKKR